MKCLHVVCAPCMKSWTWHCAVKKEEATQVFSVPCPVCRNELALDIALPTSSLKRFRRKMRLRRKMFLNARAVLVANELPDLLTSQWIDANTRTCPRCHMAIERIGGCPTMRCRCGASFHHSLLSPAIAMEMAASRLAWGQRLILLLRIFLLALILLLLLTFSISKNPAHLLPVFICIAFLFSVSQIELRCRNMFLIHDLL